jgi:hypothetical protein
VEYRKHSQFKITRTEHRIRVYVGGHAQNLIKAVSNLPLDAKLVDIEDDENGHVQLVFMTEVKDA